jgi:hypothetical protein
LSLWDHHWCWLDRQTRGQFDNCKGEKNSEIKSKNCKQLSIKRTILGESLDQAWEFWWKAFDPSGLGHFPPSEHMSNRYLSLSMFTPNPIGFLPPECIQNYLG